MSLKSANNQPLVCEPFIDREVRFATTYYLLLDKIFAMLGSNEPWSASPMVVARSLRPLWLDSPFVVTRKPDPCHFALSTRAITLNVVGQLFHECAPYPPPSNVRSIRWNQILPSFKISRRRRTPLSYDMYRRFRRTLPAMTDSHNHCFSEDHRNWSI